VGLAIQIGVPGNSLSFSNGVRIKLPSQAGKRIKFSNDGVNYFEITTTCAADSQVVGDALAAGGHCKIDVGGDLIIWTKHFTVFATFTASSSGSGGGGGGGSASVVLISSTSTRQAPSSGIVMSVNNGARLIARNEVALTFEGSESYPYFSVANGNDFSASIREVNNGYRIWNLPKGTGLKEICVRFYDASGNPTQPICKKVLYLDRTFFQLMILNRAKSLSTIKESTPKAVSTVPSSKIEACYPKKVSYIDSSLPLNKNTTLRKLVDTTKLGDFSTLVQDLQNLLRAYGFFPKDAKITGYYGDQTLASVDKYKRFINLNSRYQ
jgi:hypothetical protein